MQVFALLAGIVLLIVLVALRLHTLVALLLASMLTGLLAQMHFNKIIAAINNGVGTTLGSVTLVLVLGAMYGRLLEETGVTNKIVDVLVHSFPKKYIQWAVLVTGIVVGIPLFYNAGFVILIPLVLILASGLRLPALYLGLPMATALSITHGFLPPHPGPTTLVGLFHANMGKTLLYGFLIGIPVAVFCGVFLARLLVPLKRNISKPATETIADQNFPSTEKSLLLALLPVVLISTGTIVTSIYPKTAPGIFFYLQEAVTAFLISLFSLLLLLKVSFARATNICAEGAKTIAPILLVIAAGGAFKQVLIDSGTADSVVSATKQFALSPLLFGWLVASLLRLSIGSATVAAISAAGLVMPLMKTVAVPELMVLSVGAGSLFGSHVNDTGFWMFKEYFGLSLAQTFRTWTVVESFISLLGLGGVLLLSALM